MDKQDISSEGQDITQPTKKLLNLNQLSQQVSHPQQLQNQGGSLNIQNELENTNVSISSEQTLKRQIKSQIVRQQKGQNRIFQNAVLQIINQNEAQHAIVSKKGQNFIQHLSSKKSNNQKLQPQHQKIFQQDKNCSQNDFSQKEGQVEQKQIIKKTISENQINYLQLKQLEGKIDINQQRDEQQLSKEQILKHEQICDQANPHHQEITEKKIFQQDQNCSLDDFSQKEGQIEQKQIIKQPIYNNQLSGLNIPYQQNQQILDEQKSIKQSEKIQENSAFNLPNISKYEIKISQYRNILILPNLFEKSSINLKQNEKDIILKNQQQVNQNMQEAVQQPTKIQNNNQDNQQNTPTIIQEDQSLTNQQQFEIFKNTKNLKNLSQNYSDQLNKVLDEIDQYKYTQYEKKVEFGQIKKEWKESIFDSINSTEIQNHTFQSQKQKIFESLVQKQYYLCKIVNSNQTKGLVIGFFYDEQDDFDEYVFKIIHSSVQSDIDSVKLIIKTLGFQFKLVKLEQENISIVILKKSDFVCISKKFGELVQFEKNIQQIENNYEINSQNCQECTKCRDKKICKSYNCFKNIKSRILTFLQNKKFSYCEYQNKLINGIIFQLSQEELIMEYLNFAYKAIFSCLENDQIHEQNTYQQQTIYHESISEKKQNSLLEEKNKQINNVNLINEYQFKEYQVLKKSDENQEKSKLNLNYQRKWEINKFNSLNTIKVSDNFFKLQNIIIQTLKTKKYFLCNCFVANQQEDIFIGYEEEINEINIYYVFVIKYNPTNLETQKYLQIKQFNEEINHFIINNFVHILILKKDMFLQIYDSFEQVSKIKIEWNEDYFEQINESKDINIQNFKNCQNCKNSQGCKEHINLQKFQDQKNIIFDKLVQKNYYICEYLNKGGEGIVFQGYKQSIKEKQYLVFKILFDTNQKELQDEIQIMKMFDSHVCIIKFIDFLKVNNNISILILEKCQFSLKDELDQLQQKQEFPLNKLLQMMFNLLDGLIQFRIYNILHLDIKPQNILLNNSGQYVYTDFGISSLKKNNSEVDVKGYSTYYASPEQKNYDANIDYQSDIYSLGITFKMILDVFQKVQQQNFQEIIEEFKKKINEKMVQNLSKNRLNCLELRNEFFQFILKQKECIQFLELYVIQIKQILMSYPYDKNKEISYFLQISLFYQQSILDFWKESIQKNFQNDFKQSQQKFAQSLINVGICYQNLGDNKKALEYQQESLQIYKKLFQKNHTLIVMSLNNIGICYQNLGDNKKALKYQLESLQMIKQTFLENRHDIATSLNNVGICYQNLGDNKKTLEYLSKSLQIYKQIFQGNHPLIAMSLNNIGICYQNLGDNKNALEYQLESLQIYKQLYKENHPDIAASMNNVGRCYQNLGDNNKALQYQLESLQIYKQIFKENHPSIALSQNNVGNCYQNLGDNKKALEYQLESLKIYKQIFQENHPDTAASLNNVGSCYQNLGDNKKALKYQLESLQMRKYIFKNNHPLIANSLNNVGSCYQNLGDNKKALKYQLESLQMRKQKFQENHPDVAAILNNIGICYQNLGDNKNALEYQLESLQMIKQIFNQNHPDYAKFLNNVGMCYQNLGNYKEALEYQLESLQIRKQIFSENHPDITASLNTVGSCYQNLGKNKKALGYQLESLQMIKQIFKENHPQLAIFLNNVGQCYQNLGDNKKALKYQLESLNMTKQIFKKNHPDIAASLNNVGNCYQNIGDIKKALEYQLESLNMTKQIFKENHPSIAICLNNVGSCFQSLGDNKKALEYKFKSLQMKKQIFQENHPSIALSLRSVGYYYQKIGDSQKALEYQLESLQKFKLIYKENHPDIATSLNDVGSCYKNLGYNKKVLDYQLESLQMRKNIFQENHPLIAVSLNNVGSCYQNLRDNKKALEYFLECHKIFKQIYQENHPSIATSLNSIGICYKNMGDNKKALQNYLESLHIRKQIFKVNHSSIANSLYSISSCYNNLGDNKMDLEYQLESLQIEKQVFQENHPSIALSLNNIGVRYEYLGNNKKAMEYYLESLKIYKQIFKENDYDIALSLNNVGSCYKNLGDNKIALEYLKEFSQMKEYLKIENHPQILALLNNGK